MQKWSKVTKIALLISFSLHITAFLILRGTELYSSILYKLPRGLRIDLINVPKDSSILPSMFNKKIEVTERTWTPNKRTARLSADVSSMKISSSELPRRQIITKMDSVTRINALSVNPEISSQNLRSNPISISSLAGPAQGMLLRAAGTAAQGDVARRSARRAGGTSGCRGPYAVHI